MTYIIRYLFYEINNYNYYNVGTVNNSYFYDVIGKLFLSYILFFEIISTSVHLAIVIYTSTTGLPTVTPAETDTNDMMNNTNYTTIVIANSSSFIIL